MAARRRQYAAAAGALSASALLLAAVASCGEVAAVAIRAGDERDASTDAAEAGPVSDASTDGAEVGSPSDASTDAGAADGDAGPSLPVTATAARLWLSADYGVTCTAGRVTRWADRSGRGDDGVLSSGQLGPQCQPSDGPHLLRGVPVPYFGAPANGNVVDETLDVDLGFLARSGYTIVVVERRWADVRAEFILGTAAPFQNAIAGCSPNPNTDEALQFGYVYYNGQPQLVLDHSCDGFLMNASPVPATPPAPFTYDVARFDPSIGHELFIDDATLANPALTTPIGEAIGGSIGRAFSDTVDGSDARFQGDIAEVIVYDAALASADLQAVQAYVRSHWAL